MQVYEALFIFDSNKFARDQTGLPGNVEQMIKEAGGEIVVSRLWEERRLAYAIKGQRKGTYWLIYFRLDTGEVAPLNRKCELHDAVLRHLVLKIHPSLVEPILEHAAESTRAASDESEGDEQSEAEKGEPVGASAN